MGKKFNQWLRAMGNAGIYVGDLNQASAAFTGQAPLPQPPEQQQAPPQAPAPIKRNTNPRTIGDTDGDNLKIKRKSKRRRRQLSKGTGQLRINPSSTANVGGSGVAAKSGGVNA